MEDFEIVSHETSSFRKVGRTTCRNARSTHPLKTEFICDEHMNLVRAALLQTTPLNGLGSDTDNLG
eukprot:884648-Amphidinium_carterae.2